MNHQASLRQTDPLLIAAKANDAAGLRQELAQRYPGERPPDVLIRVASQMGHLEALGVLLDAGAWTGTCGAFFGSSALHAAAANGHRALVERLLEHGVDVNLVDAAGHQPLYDAIREQRVPMAEFLLAQGATLDHVLFTIQGQVKPAMVHVMLDLKSPELTLLLVRHGAADAEHPLNLGMGNAPLHVAAASDWPEVVQAMLDRGHPVDPRNQRLDTPLKIAVKNGRLEVVNRLMAAGADPMLVSESQESPLSLARAIGGPMLGAVERGLLRRTVEEQTDHPELLEHRGRVRL